MKKITNKSHSLNNNRLSAMKRNLFLLITAVIALGYSGYAYHSNSGLYYFFAKLPMAYEPAPRHALILSAIHVALCYAALWGPFYLFSNTYLRPKPSGHTPSSAIWRLTKGCFTLGMVCLTATAGALLGLASSQPIVVYQELSLRAHQGELPGEFAQIRATAQVGLQSTGAGEQRLVPITHWEWNTQQELSYILRTGKALEDILLRYEPNAKPAARGPKTNAGNNFLLANVRVVKSGLSADERAAFSQQGLRIAEPHYVVQLNEQTDSRILYSWIMAAGIAISGILLLCAALLAALTPLATGPGTRECRKTNNMTNAWGYLLAAVLVGVATPSIYHSLVKLDTEGGETRVHRIVAMLYQTFGTEGTLWGLIGLSGCFVVLSIRSLMAVKRRR